MGPERQSYAGGVAAWTQPAMRQRVASRPYRPQPAESAPDTTRFSILNIGVMYC